MNQSTPQAGPGISDAMWVAALSAATYAVAFSYEAGYARYFHVPVNLISISPTLLLKVGGALMVVMIPLYILIMLIWPLLPRSDTAPAKLIKRVAQDVIFIIFILTPYLIHGDYWLLFLGLIGFIIFFEVIIPLIVHRKIPTFEKKFSEQNKINREFAEHSVVWAMVMRFGRAPVMFLLILSLATSFANGLGGEEAKKQTEFMLVKGDPNIVMLALYDNLFVTQSFDPRSKTLVGYLKVMRLGDGKDIELAPGDVGPLKASKPAK
jgi:phage shock protein PspC (stress-responsive transcriptional regulator)